MNANDNRKGGASGIRIALMRPESRGKNKPHKNNPTTTPKKKPPHKPKKKKKKTPQTPQKPKNQTEKRGGSRRAGGKNHPGLDLKTYASRKSETGELYHKKRGRLKGEAGANGKNAQNRPRNAEKKEYTFAQVGQCRQEKNRKGQVEYKAGGTTENS